MRTLNLETLQNFAFSSEEENNQFTVKSPIEKTSIYEDEGRRFINRNGKVTQITEKYFPVFDSQILASFIKKDYYQDIKDDIEKITLEDDCK